MLWTADPRERRAFARLSTVGLAAALLSACVGDRSVAGTEAASPARLNIVIILADDMGFSDIGAFGGEIPTPHIDALARGGVSFSNFYNSGRCWPSRAALMSGRDQHDVGLGGELQYRDDKGVVHPAQDKAGPYQGYYRLDFPMLSERLREAGYRTYAVGKWHLGDVDRRSWPTRRGFDRYFGPVTGTDSYFSSQTDPARPRAYRAYIDDDTVWPVPKQGFYATTEFTRRAVGFVEDRKREVGKPLFLYLAYTAPHWPLQALPEDVAAQTDRYRDGWDSLRARRFARQRALRLLTSDHRLPPRPADIPSWRDVPDKQRASALMEVYAAQIAAMDRGVGEVVEALRRRGQLDNTIILFLSDNGATDEDLAQRPSTAKFNDQRASPGSARRFEAYTRNWAYVSNTPYRHYKAAMGEGGIRTPLIVHWPSGVQRPGSLQLQVGHVIDIAPTLLDAAGRGSTRRADLSWASGRSLLGSIESPSRPESRRLFFEHMGNRAIRDGRWKAVNDREGVWRLYDLESDPTELNDRASAEPARLKLLVGAWEDWARTSGISGYGAGNRWLTSAR